MAQGRGRFEHNNTHLLLEMNGTIDGAIALQYDHGFSHRVVESSRLSLYRRLSLLCEYDRHGYA